ncbi:MAG: biotin--[acetyl-CoA-carboxylase] ligase [Nitrospirota bacterium]
MPSIPFQPLTREAVLAQLRTKTLGRSLHVLDEVASTNTYASELAQRGAGHGTVVVAERQTAGKGRLGRHWHSPAAGNLYCSVIIQQPVPPALLATWLSWLPLVSAVSVARAVQTIAEVHPSLKWPNDVLIGDWKLGGLLCESGGWSAPSSPSRPVTDRLEGFVVIGIGLNVNMGRGDFPEELRSLATSLAEETSHAVDRSVLLAAILSELEDSTERLLPSLSKERDRFVTEYSRWCTTLGRPVRVSLADGRTVEGRADSIGTDGSLRLVLAETGTTLEIRAGDVLHLR